MDDDVRDELVDHLDAAVEAAGRWCDRAGGDEQERALEAFQAAQRALELARDR